MVLSVRISNYKSLGAYNNELLVSPALTAIIGKNESGKTNLVDALGELDFAHSCIDSADKKLNRLAENGQINISLTFCTQEIQKTTITARADGLSVSGGLVSAVFDDAQVRNYLNNPALRQRLAHFREDFCANPYAALERAQAALASEHNPAIRSILFELEKKLKHYVLSMPYILHVDSDQINTFREYYFLDELHQITSDDIFYKLINVALGRSEADSCPIHQAFGEIGSAKPRHSKASSTEDSPSSRRLASTLVRSGLESIAARFSRIIGHEFQLGYIQKEGRLYLTSGKDTMLDELSISLRWGFALFVDILFRNIQNHQILFVLDQPGLYMHINAQKELLKILIALTKRGHQIIYTTHSPFLLDISEIGSIRAVEKKGGVSRIYNKIYAGEVSRGSKMETLTPILEALGASFSPRVDDEGLNIIVEGISDYYYLKAMLHYLHRPNQTMPYVLPSVGASNIANVAAILIGWGMPFKAIVDCDEEGKRAAERMSAHQGLKLGEEIFYINGATTYKAGEECRVEDLLAKADIAKLKKPKTKLSKALMSKSFYDKIKDGTLTPEPQTIQNFQKLFKAMSLN